MPKVMLWFAVVPVFAPLLFVGCSLLPGAQGVRVDHSSPLALFESYYQAFQAKDLDAALECQAPEERRSVKVGLDVLWEYDRWWVRLQELVARKIGKPEALLFSSTIPGILGSMAEELKDGRIIQQTDSDATVALTKPPPVRLKRINGQWYIWDDLATPSPFSLREAITEEMVKSWGRTREYFQTVQRRIKRGDINRDNFREWLDGEFKRNLGISGDPAENK